jgi:hypothetical protein
MMTEETSIRDLGRVKNEPSYLRLWLPTVVSHSFTLPAAWQIDSLSFSLSKSFGDDMQQG